MKKKNIYSKLVPATLNWGRNLDKGAIIRLLHRCVELDTTSFLLNDISGSTASDDGFGIALSESGLSRDKIQLIGICTDDKPVQEQVEEILMKSHSDYLDLLFIREDLLKHSVIPSVEVQQSRGKVVELGTTGTGFSQKDFGSLQFSANLIQWPPNSGEKVLQHQVPREMDKFVWMKEEITISEDPEIVDLERKYAVTSRQLLTGWLISHSAHFHVAFSETDKKYISAAVDVQNINFEKEDLSLLTRKLEQTKNG